VTAWVGDWVRAFGLTVTAEMVVAVPLLRRAESSVARRAAVVLLVNLATHPLVWFLFPGLALGYATKLAMSEVFAVGVEAGAYGLIVRSLGAPRGLLVSLLANGASLALGLALRATHLVP
jgi:hypothetical protein